MYEKHVFVLLRFSYKKYYTALNFTIQLTMFIKEAVAESFMLYSAYSKVGRGT